MLGVLSLIFWSLVWVVSIKYLVFVMRADRDGEGGILALMSLAVEPDTNRSTPEGLRPSATTELPSAARRKPSGTSNANGPAWAILLGLFGAALLYGDGAITPAISVLSAIEGVHVATNKFDHFVIPVSIVILFALFWIQKRGTAKIGRLFAPAMVVWFVVIASLGAVAIAESPEVLAALNPIHAASFLIRGGLTGLAILGVVFLVVTGGEALYADMGHFGKRPIRVAWFAIVLPGLLLNYFGQGALLLTDPSTITNPFYELAPSWALIPLVLLATIATIIASQAIISGVFSLTSQAVAMGYLPRITIIHTSKDQRGQIYVPTVNWMMFVAVVGLVLAFRTSDQLAAAYGMAVTSTMVITSILLFLVARRRWTWSAPIAIGWIAAFLMVDVSFFVANLPKIPDGGWFPLLVGLLIGGLMTTWRRGKQIVADSLADQRVSVDDLLRYIAERRESPGTTLTAELVPDGLRPSANTTIRIDKPAVHLSADADSVPLSLLHNLHHNGVLHRPIALLTIVTSDRPWVQLDDRVSMQSLGNDLYQIVAHFGYKQPISVPQVLQQCRDNNADFTGDDVTFILGRMTLDVNERGGMATWRKRWFSFLRKSADDPSSHFAIPPNQVVEIGLRLTI